MLFPHSSALCWQWFSIIICGTKSWTKHRENERLPEIKRNILHYFLLRKRNEQTFIICILVFKKFDSNRANRRTQGFHYSDTGIIMHLAFPFQLLSFPFQCFLVCFLIFYLKLWSLKGLRTFLLNLSKHVSFFAKMFQPKEDSFKETEIASSAWFS